MVALALPIVAQDWQSTSVMQGSGSAYSSQVTTVGAATAVSEATTTDSYSAAKVPSGPRRIEIYTPAEDEKPNAPLGDAVLPLLLMAAAYIGIVAIRRKRTPSKEVS